MTQRTSKVLYRVSLGLQTVVLLIMFWRYRQPGWDAFMITYCSLAYLHGLVFTQCKTKLAGFTKD